MARYYRRRRTIVRTPKKKWATNIVNFNDTTAGSATAQFAAVKLVENSAQSARPTPVIVKAGNFKIQGDVFVNSGNVASQTEISMYVIYVPEGINLPDALTSRNLLLAHPEWIIAWKFISSNVSTANTPTNSDSFTFSSRLKRNLNSGDSIYLLCLAQSQAMQNAVFAGMAQYWTCAN